MSYEHTQKVAEQKQKGSLVSYSFLLAASCLLLTGLALGWWHIARFAQHSSAAVTFRYPLDGLEGTLLYEARLLRAGEPLYQPLQPDRFISAPYQPLSYVALAAAESIAYQGGAPPPDVTQGPIFQPGRTVSLIAMTVAGILLALAVWRIGGSITLAMLAACLWFGFPPVQLWATRIKPDPLALAFTTAGVLAVVWRLTEIGDKRLEIRTPRSPISNLQSSNLRLRSPSTSSGTEAGQVSNLQSPISHLPLVLAAFCFALAYFTKQTAVAAPIATALTLLLLGDGRTRNAERSDHSMHYAIRPMQYVPLSFIVFTTIYLLLIGITWLALDFSTARQYSAHVWGLHQTEWWSADLFFKYFDLLLYSWPMLVLALFAGIVTIANYVVHTVQHAGRLWCSLYVLCAVPTILAAGAQGAHHNHLLEPYLALVLAGCSLVRFTIYDLRFWMRSEQSKIQNPTPKIFALGALALLLLQLWLLVERPAWYGGEFELAQQERTQFVRLIQSQPGEVLADDVALLLAAGRPLRYDDPSTMGPAISSGIWDQRNLLAEVADRRFALILLPFDATRLDRDPAGRWSPEFIATLRVHYRILYRDVIFSYVPK